MTPAELRSLAESSTTPLAFAEALKGLTEADRKKLSKTAQDIYREVRAKERGNFGVVTEEGAIAKLALLACCGWTDAKRVNNTGRFGMFPTQGAWTDAARQILLDRRPASAQDWIAMRLAETPQLLQSFGAFTWGDVRQLVKAGVIARPTGDGYIRVMAGGWPDTFDPVRDADVFDGDVWRLFEVETHAFSSARRRKRPFKNTRKGPSTPKRGGWRNSSTDGPSGSMWQPARGGSIGAA